MEHARPLELSEGLVRSLDVETQAHELLDSLAVTHEEKLGRTLVKSAGLTVVLTAVRGGGRLPEHRARGPVLVMPVLGSVRVVPTGENGPAVDVPRGRVLVMAPDVAHCVVAADAAAFLLVIGPQSA